MIKSLALVAVVALGSQAFAEDSAHCDLLANQAMMYANITNNTTDPLVSVEGGRLKINKESKRLKSRNEAPGGRKSTLTFDRVVITPAGPMTITETIDYDATKRDAAIKYMTDKKFSAMLPTPIYGQKVTLHDDGNGNCTLVQSSNFVKDNMRSFAELVKSDKVFCDSVKDVIKDMGKETFEQCQGSLKKASALYNKRAKELEKTEQKFISMGDNTLATTVEALRSCSPEEWRRNMTTPLGPGMIVSSPLAQATPKEAKGKVIDTDTGQN